MNRPERKNALGRKFLFQFTECMKKVKFDKSIRVVILRSLVPGVFCAGADLKERAQMTDAETGPFVAGLRASVNDMDNLPMPTIAAIDGVALGGGTEVSLACDLRVASTTAKMGLVETRLAIIPGGGGTQRLPRIINPAVARELMYTARVVEGREAERIGMVNHCVEQNENGDAGYLRALKLAQEILPQGPVALRMAKMAISRGSEVDLHSALYFEEAGYSQVIPTRDRREAMKAFMEKRKPKFEGH
ncbi:Methylglutaconyl-CoA hydratase, mitochondrial [Mizuhopecten yessoensis]|uniref:Methylglutaconyl-CoA hydratase, mitochondrial n=2 Tax=Mizuhopecten yessoensis TaxID=6573 RepID=A0A210Q942_MIZYE|nr:Methylglutaconyl-CoA hydratase, mitochondrial [Mizuhopecten yessoensis]